MPPFYTVSSSEARSVYLIVNDQVNSIIYNLDKSKTVRVIPHKDGGVRTYIILPKKDMLS
ncbi:hypothetical protein [Chitinophaga pinensis]|uniref:Uncharacterized protein n=1 Tax=Chitinophaga pinensis TaxID=79329 RepID=A0A5C6LN10_9BACT|nr:hypothetical protein [Chitinophaga pinensis]TWV98700.1 hypothetical protein FEF09_20685 [Chitinophaga pinensis]